MPSHKQPLCDTTVAILAGGLGTRLKTIVPDKPKALVNFGDRPFLSFLLDQLTSAGAKDVVLCTGYMADEIHEKIGNSYHSLRLSYSKEDSPLGTGGALRHALPHLKSEVVMVMNGDSFVNIDLAVYLDWFSKRHRRASVLLTFVSDTRPYGKVDLEDDGLLTAFEEKSTSSGPGWVNAGIYIIQKSLIAAFPDSEPFSLERELFPKLTGNKFFGYRHEGEFIDIGTPETYALAKKIFQDRKR